MSMWHAVAGIIILGAAAGAAVDDRPAEVPPLETAVAPVFYPDLPNEDGAVMVTLIVSREGRVIRARASDDGHAGYLAHAADWEKTATRWRYAARKSGGEISVNIGFAFRRLPRGTPPEQLTPVFHGRDQVEVRSARNE